MTNGSMKWLMVVVVLAMVVGYVTCDCAAEKTTALTYNTGLTTTVYGYDQRRFNVVQTLKQLENNVDFMCMQELWFEDDVKRVVDWLGSVFPYHYSAIHADVGQLRMKPQFGKPSGRNKRPCRLWQISKLLACVGWNCHKSVNKRQCLVEKCPKSLYSLPQDCRSCFSVASSSVWAILAKCTPWFKKYTRMNRPGLLVLSNQPLTSVEYVNYHEGRPVLLERGYIKAEVDGGNTYVCTHLTSVFPYYFEANLTEYNSFLEQQEAEIRQVQNAFSNVPHLLLGDLNTGPERNEAGLPPLAGEAAANYDILTTELGYQNPYLQNKGNCTYCPLSNPVLKAAKVQYSDAAIDFVLTSSGVNADVTSAMRVLDSPSVLLSDHFGVQVDICQP